MHDVVAHSQVGTCDGGIAAASNEVCSDLRCREDGHRHLMIRLETYRIKNTSDQRSNEAKRGREGYDYAYGVPGIDFINSDGGSIKAGAEDLVVRELVDGERGTRDDMIQDNAPGAVVAVDVPNIKIRHIFMQTSYQLLTRSMLMAMAQIVHKISVRPKRVESMCTLTLQ